MIGIIHAVVVSLIFGIFFYFHIKNLVDAIRESNKVWITNSIILLVFGILFVIYYVFH